MHFILPFLLCPLTTDFSSDELSAISAFVCSLGRKRRGLAWLSKVFKIPVVKLALGERMWILTRYTAGSELVL
jgi:hypothetical protein